MVINDENKAIKNRSVRPKLLSVDSTDTKIGIKSDKKHRLKQRFEVIKKLGQGTYGKVQLAINKETGHEVAIKTIKKSKVESDQDLIRIRREIQIMSSIQHPHIIHIFEVFENKDKIVLVMQYANGGEVYDYVSARKVLSDYEARRLFRQIATAIYYCHKNKICHRDLKLENILLDEKGNAKIADFGLSNVFDDRHYLSTFCGSPLYASPEIVKGTPYYGPEVDCWSLGVLLYTLVYGAMPFDGSNFKRLVKQISDANYFEPKQKSDASELIRRLLTPNPSKRATIIDICTDSWVNKDYEHSLLQVSEDMANLTPVRLDILVALAPVSPTAETDQKAHPLADQNMEPVNQELKDQTEEKVEEDSSNLDTFAKKRQASTSFDQSLTKVSSSQVPRKKKTKKSENDSSAKVSAKDIPLENIETDKITSESDEKSVNNIPEIDDTIIKTDEQQFDNIGETLPSVENIAADSDQTETIQLENLEKSVNNLIECLPTSIEQKEIKSNLDEAIKTDSSLNEQNINLEKESVNENISEKLVSNESNLKIEKIDDKDVVTDQKPSLDNEVKDNESFEKKKKVSRTSSTNKRPGRLSIPKLWEKSADEPNSSSPTIKSPESKPNLQTNDSKISPENKLREKKVPFIPVGFKVSDAKKAFERRCSVPAINTSFSSFMRKNDGKQNKAISDKTDIKAKPKPPKLSLRSLSLNDELESPKKVKEAVIDVTNNMKLKNVDEENRIQTKSDDTLNDNKVGKDKEKKTLAKDILKKTIAKAKLNEKRQNSDSDSTHSSPVTTPLVSIENSSSTPLQTTFRIPRPFNKDNLEKVTIKPNTTIELKINPNILSILPQLDDSNPILNTETEMNVNEQKPDLDLENVETLQSQEMKPITRSYKKVTFTKDGACITETGKIYSSQGTDGTFTRVEKKSKVTHFPSQDNDIQVENTSNIDNKFNIQRSDSLSSSGSTDIFEDIFDNHWSGDSIFPNMRSFFQGMIRKDKKSRRRSRAESCERNSSDWFSSGFGSRRFNSNLTDHESDTDNDNESQFSSSGQQSSWQQYLRPHGSIFDRSSIFSRHFNKDVNREFDDLGHPFHEFSRSLSRDRSTFSSRIHPSSYKVVFGSHANKTSDLDANNTSSSFNRFDVNVKSKLAERPRDRWSRELSDTSFSDKDYKTRFDDNLDKSWDASRKRVEQWLQTDINEDIDESDKKGSYSMYGTVGPRGFRRYLRTLSGRSTQDKFKDFTSDSPVNSRMSSISRISNTPSYQSPTILSHKTKPIVEMKFSLNSSSINAENKSILNSSSTLNDVNSINFSNCPTSPTLESSEFGDDFQTSITLPESSSLLDQLRTHGYRNIVSQRLCSGSSLFNDLEWKSTESSSNLTETDSNYKKGNYKNVYDSESSAMSDFKQNVCENACECMETNPKATATATATTNGAIASDKTGSYAADCALKQASEPITTAAHVESADSHHSNIDNDIVNLKLKHTVNQQSCEPSTRITTYAARSTTTGDLPECNPNLQKNNTINTNVTLKETVQERIHRKSFYSRFNDDRPPTPRQRRRSSFLDNDIIDSNYGNKYSLNQRASNFSSSSFRNSLLLDNHNSFGSKLTPSPSTANWFNRMESRASQLMNDLMVNDKLNMFDDDFKSRDIDRPFSERRQSNSTVRSSYSTPRSLRSDYDSYSTSLSNNISDNDDNNDSSNLNSLLEGIRSPREVLRRAINLLED